MNAFLFDGEFEFIMNANEMMIDKMNEVRIGTPLLNSEMIYEINQFLLNTVNVNVFKVNLISNFIFMSDRLLLF